MGLNAFVVKKHGAFILCGFLPSFLFFYGLISYNFIYGMVFLFAGIFASNIAASKLMSHPQLEVLEGKGLRVLTFDSTGVMQLFLVKVRKPFMDLFLKGKVKNDVFDRNNVHYWANPKYGEMSQESKTKEIKERIRDENGKIIEEKVIGYETENEIVIKLPKKELSTYHFSFESSPCLVYNGIIGELYTKELLSQLETKLFVQHLVLYLNRKVDELTSHIRDFARYVVEQTKPKPSLFSSKIVWFIIIAVVVVMLIILFAPALMKTLNQLSPELIPTGTVNPK